MKILSIDWDYFFPDPIIYDWSANEENPIYFEIAWATRITSRNMNNGNSVLDEYFPTIPKDFWKIITNKPKCHIAESHAAIWKLIQKSDFIELTNIDAHHDCGYHKLGKHVDCGNWGAWGQAAGYISRFRLIYPEWRKQINYEAKLEAWFPKDVSYELPKPQDYDLVFICRSSCWTPPWFDNKFTEFVESSKLKVKYMDEYVCKPRKTEDMKVLREYRDVQLKQFEDLMNASRRTRENGIETTSV